MITVEKIAGRKNRDSSPGSGFRLRGSRPPPRLRSGVGLTLAKRLNFNPRPRNRSPWDKYREAWCQMACPNEETGPSKIVAERCQEQLGSTQTCPLKQLV